MLLHNIVPETVSCPTIRLFPVNKEKSYYFVPFCEFSMKASVFYRFGMGEVKKWVVAH